MKLMVPLMAMGLVFSSCSSFKQDEVASTMPDKKTIGLLPTEKEPELQVLAEFEGVQVTGVTVTEGGRLFANFPRWREGVPFSVVEVMKDGSYRPYPDKEWNSWEGKPQKNKFTSVQSVVAKDNSLFVLDPASPEMKGVVGKAQLYEFDLSTNKLKRSWSFSEAVAPKTSYLNDLRIDDNANKVYITDSGLGGIVVLDLMTGESRRVLDKHPSTKSENVTLTVEEKEFTLANGQKPQIHSDGIALNPQDGKLYYNALTSYSLYRVPAAEINAATKDETSLVKKVENLGAKPASDGMVFDDQGNLYMADLERNAISYRTPEGELKILVQDENIKWADTLTIDLAGNSLIFTDSLLQDAPAGKSAEGMSFKIYKVALPPRG